MKITAIKVFQADLPLVDGSYKWADGKRVDTYDSTVVAVHTDNPAIIGYGEVVPLGPNYLPSYAAGVRSGLLELGPKLIGEDPTQIKVLNHLMDYHLKGHPYVKSPIDMAFWDILGKVSNVPVSTLLGGRCQDDILLYRAISQGSPEEMAKLVKKYKNQGYTRFQLKLGGLPSDDISRILECHKVLGDSDVLIGDANTGWLSHGALQVAKGVKHLAGFYMEQPCATYKECQTVRAHTDLPFVLDESVNDLSTLIQAWNDCAADVVNIKISKFGGLTKAKQAIDFCCDVGLAMTIEDTWGGDITTAAILNLAGTVPAKLQFTATDFNSYNTVKTGSFLGDGGLKTHGGQRMKVPGEFPGLGIQPNWNALKLLHTIQ